LDRNRDYSKQRQKKRKATVTSTMHMGTVSNKPPQVTRPTITLLSKGGIAWARQIYMSISTAWSTHKSKVAPNMIGAGRMFAAPMASRSQEAKREAQGLRASQARIEAQVAARWMLRRLLGGARSIACSREVWR
jgi:hypothetical protein